MRPELAGAELPSGHHVHTPMDWEAILAHSVSLEDAGVALAWCVAHSEQVPGQIVNAFWRAWGANDVWHRTRRRRQVLPLRKGEFIHTLEWLRGTSPEKIRAEKSRSDIAEECWVICACFACNSLRGHHGPFPNGRWSKLEKKMVSAVRASVQRFLSHGRAHHSDFEGLEKDLLSRRLSYTGEELKTCHRLTLKQVVPSLPPQEHGGSIDLVNLVTPTTAHWLNNPMQMLVEDLGQELPKLQGKIHADPRDVDAIADELVARNVCQWLDFDKVLHFRGEPVLNGLFGVEKSGKVDDNLPILRCIMNLVPSNSVMRNFQGAVGQLPHITSWMSTVILEGQEVRFWQSDMCNAFYLFKLPSQWAPLLCFNVIRNCSDHPQADSLPVQTAGVILQGATNGLVLFSSHHAGGK